MIPEGCFVSRDSLESIYMACHFETLGHAIRSLVLLATF